MTLLAQLLVKNHPIEIDVLDTPTIDRIMETVEDADPHVLHFIGHSRLNEAYQGVQLAFLQPDGKSVSWARDRDFAELFRFLRTGPRVVVLHPPEVAARATNTPFGQTAVHLVRRGIPAVVAMQRPISNQAAIAFYRAFYREVAKGEPVDAAVETSRWRIGINDPSAYDSGSFSAPLIVTTHHEGILLLSEDLHDQHLGEDLRNA